MDPRAPVLAMPHHVYRLSDDTVPVVVIAPGPLPMPAPHERNAVRELIGVFEDLAEAEEVARQLRAAAVPVRRTD